MSALRRWRGRLERWAVVWRRRGPGFPFRLLQDWLVPRVVYGVFSRAPFSRIATRFRPRPRVPSGPRSRPAADHFVAAESWLPEETRKEVLRRQQEDAGATILLGRIDNDGRLLPVLGPVPDFDLVSSDDFVPRYRYDVDLVVEDGRVLVRKGYRGDREGFLREWASLARLEGSAAPAVHRADEDRLELSKAFLPGPTLRQYLVEAGARILSVETESDPEIQALEGVDRLEAVWSRGRERFSALPEGTVDELERRLDAVHRHAVTGFSLTYGNVALVGAEEEPQFLDFDGADVHRRPEGVRFALARDRDRRLFRRIYGRDLLTEKTARAALRRVSTPYSPVDLGRGLATQGFWSVDSGTGRWETLNRPVLRDLVVGSRILDLGSYNALLPLLMLADGAREVVAVESSAEMIPVAEDLRRLFEWRDMRRYDLDLRHADMRAVLDEDWGPFDLVTAFCSLYYLEEEDMVRVVRRAAELAPMMILQAKTDTRAGAAGDKARKSSLEFLRDLLRRNGFPAVEEVVPPAVTRPLLIGRREQSGWIHEN